MATVNIGADEFVTWDKRVAITRTATVTNPSGTVTYAWTFSSRPTGSTATLTGANSSSVSFTPDKAGEYVLLCTVTDSSGQVSDSAKITVRATHYVRKNGVKSPVTMRAKVTPPSVVTSTVEETV